MADITLDDVKTAIKTAQDDALTALDTQKRSVLQELASAASPRIVADPKEAEYRSIAKELTEKRAVTLSSTSVGVIEDMISKLASSTGGIFDKLDLHYTDVQLGTVPVMAPLTEFVYAGEGATGVAADSAALAAVQLNLQSYMGVLPISNGVDIFSQLVGKLPSMYANALKRTIIKQMCQGTGTNSFTGLSANASITQIPAATGSVANGLKWADLVKAVKAFKGSFELDDTDGLVLMIHPSIIQDCITNGTNSALDISALTSYNSGNPNILGVKILETPFAPSTKTNGLAAALIGYLPHYCVGISKAFKLKAIDIARADSVEYTGIVYADGKPLSNTSFARLNFTT